MFDLGPVMGERSEPSITQCWQNLGWHANGAGPCFGTREQAEAFGRAERDWWDRVAAAGGIQAREGDAINEDYLRWRYR